MSEPGFALDDSTTDETQPDRRREEFDRLAEEFAERCRRGESVSISEYEGRYPEHAEKVRKYLPTVALMEQLKRETLRKRGDVDESSRPVPERFGEFRVIRELGRGGMGIVYQAVQDSLGRHVALKVIHHVQFDTKRLLRFRREAQAVARLHHAHIVPIFGVGEHEGLPYYVMPYIRGDGLDVLLARWREGNAPPAAERWRFVAKLGLQAAEALHYAHEQGILHRDIKPANLLLDEDRSVRIADFGLAKLIGQEDLTASGDIIGTLRYLAPEALRGESDYRSDVYSLGLTLYELLTLSPPFGEVSQSELLRQVSEGQPAPPRKLDPAIPRDLETIVLKATSREPTHRYATAGALADDLRRFLEDRPIRARRVSPVERLWRWSRRNPMTATLAATAAASLVIAAVVGWVGLRVESLRRQEAEAANRKANENVALSLEGFAELFDKLTPPGSAFPPPTGRTGRPDRGRPPGNPRSPGGGGPPFGGPPHEPGGNPFDDGRPPIRGGALAGPAADTEVLRSVLSFYERFASRNATDSRLQGEAARAYHRVGALYERMGREEDAELANSRAIEMFDDLIARFPKVAEYRSRMVDVVIMADPWSVDPSTLERLEGRLRRARDLIDRLALDDRANLTYVQSQIHVHAKLGATLERRGRLDEAEASYRRAIDLAGNLIERTSRKLRPRTDRVDIRLGLGALLIERDRTAEVRILLNEAEAELRPLVASETIGPPFADRIEGLADLFRDLGETRHADELDRWAESVAAHGRRGGPGPGPGRKPLGRFDNRP